MSRRLPTPVCHQADAGVAPPAAGVAATVIVIALLRLCVVAHLPRGEGHAVEGGGVGEGTGAAGAAGRRRGDLQEEQEADGAGEEEGNRMATGSIKLFEVGKVIVG